VDWLASTGTAYAVLDHAWSDIRKQGTFHPEVLSLVYLLISMIRKNYLSAAAFTWITVFGRHLIQRPPNAVELSPKPVPGKKGAKPIFEVSVSRAAAESDKTAVLGLLPAVIRYALMGDASVLQGNLLDGIRDVSDEHDDVLHGLGDYAQGIPIKIQK
jgi:hypothetical protein